MSEHRVTPPVVVPGQKLTGPPSYFASIEKNYGRPIQDWLDLAADLLDAKKHMEAVEFLKAEHGMGHGHANAIVAYTKRAIER
ncbi:MAG TPA: DUF4287 domain-containing protein [Candidatus Lumbricidophila sp.]|nr:DUF4287 domain-containing protein [Candidatus Lumbricidophila sp.]